MTSTMPEVATRLDTVRLAESHVLRSRGLPDEWFPFLPKEHMGCIGVILHTHDLDDLDGPVGWLVTDEVIGTHPELAPYRGMRGWWLTEDEIIGRRPAVDDGHLSEVPQEYRYLIPEGSRWGMLSEEVDDCPPGRFLAFQPGARSLSRPEDWIVIAWPGHPRHDLFGDRSRYGLPQPLQGYWAMGQFVPDDSLTGEPTEAPTEAEADDGPRRTAQPVEAVFVEATRVTELQERIGTLEAELQRVRAETATAMERASDYVTRLNEATNRHDSDLDQIATILREEAERRDWCGEYETVIQRINENIHGHLEGMRDVEVDVSFSGTITVPYSGSVTLTIPFAHREDTSYIRSEMEEFFQNARIRDYAELGEADWDEADPEMDDYEEA